MRSFLLVLALTAISGCAVLPQSGESAFAKSATPTKPAALAFRANKNANGLKARSIIKKAPVFGGEVVVAGPKGYCIDAHSITAKATGAFALLASCQNLSAGQIGKITDAAIMTITVLPRRIGATQPDAEALISDGATVLERVDGDGLSLVHLSQGGNSFSPSLDAKYWRGGMLINGHIVGIALYAPKNSSLAGSTGRLLAMSMAEQLRTVSPAKVYAPTTVTKSTSIAATQVEKSRKNPVKNIFPHMFQ